MTAQLNGKILDGASDPPRALDLFLSCPTPISIGPMVAVSTGRCPSIQNAFRSKSGVLTSITQGKISITYDGFEDTIIRAVKQLRKYSNQYRNFFRRHFFQANSLNPVSIKKKKLIIKVFASIEQLATDMEEKFAVFKTLKKNAHKSFIDSYKKFLFEKLNQINGGCVELRNISTALDGILEEDINEEGIPILDYVVCAVDIILALSLLPVQNLTKGVVNIGGNYKLLAQEPIYSTIDSSSSSSSSSGSSSNNKKGGPKKGGEPSEVLIKEEIDRENIPILNQKEFDELILEIHTEYLEFVKKRDSEESEKSLAKINSKYGAYILGDEWVQINTQEEYDKYMRRNMIYAEIPKYYAPPNLNQGFGTIQTNENPITPNKNLMLPYQNELINMFKNTLPNVNIAAAAAGGYNKTRRNRNRNKNKSRKVRKTKRHNKKSNKGTKKHKKIIKHKKSRSNI